MIDDRHISRQAATEHLQSPFVRLSGEAWMDPKWQSGGGALQLAGKRLHAHSVAPHAATEGDV